MLQLIAGSDGCLNKFEPACITLTIRRRSVKCALLGCAARRAHRRNSRGILRQYSFEFFGLLMFSLAQGAAWLEETPPSRYFDPPLTKRGQVQAHIAGQAISSLPHTFNAIYCSPQLRCLETAAPIATQLGLVSNNPRTHCLRADARSRVFAENYNCSRIKPVRSCY